MSTGITIGGVVYQNPVTGDNANTGWGTNVHNILQALAANIASSPTFMQVVTVTTTPTTIATGFTYLVTTASIAITLNLPSPAANAWFIVKDISQKASTNNITIHRFASESIDGQVSDFVMKANNSAYIFVSDGTNWWSLASANDLILSDTANGAKTYRLSITNGIPQYLELT